MDDGTLKLWVDDTITNIGRLVHEYQGKRGTLDGRRALEEARLDASFLYYMLNELTLREKGLLPNRRGVTL